MRLRCWLPLAGLLIVLSNGANAAPEPAPTSSVGVRQERVARMMQEIEQRFLALAKSLEATEPERSTRLVKAFEQSKTRLIEPRMREIVSLLDASNLENAGAEEQQVVDDIRALIATLLAEDTDRAGQKEEIECLKRWHQQLSMLIRDERRQQAESLKFDQKQSALEGLAKQIASVQELIRREQELIAATARTRAAGISGLERLADQQQTIRQDTQFVAQELAQASQPAGTPQAAPRAADESLPAPPGQRPLERSAEHQQNAEARLSAAQGKSAQEDEERALEELKTSLRELEREHDRIAKSPDEALQQMAAQQQATAQAGSSLNNQVSQAGQAGKPGAGACQACSQCLGGACQSMQSAAGSLSKQSPGAASSSQAQATDQLQRAKQEVEKRLAELGEKIDDEVIVRLEDIFREMLTRQQLATAETSQLDAQRQADRNQPLRRGDRITLRRLSQEEHELSGLAQRALDLIEADGTTISFPAVVSDVRDHLEHISQLIEREAIGEPTPTLQKDIEQTLEELIEALQVAKKSGGAGSGKPGKCKPCLLPDTAELKLLRSLQLRVNRRTRAVDEQKTDLQPDDLRKAELARVSKTQREIAGMVQAILERSQAPAAASSLLPDPGRPIDLDFRSRK